ncbi:ATP-binding protein [Stigmatella aurantiaca]|uniref:histidine kinase n=1 Tax=Stigmatella aurantiaca (strain DW4/3-1) TaxID=378806 RepID=Q08NQ7_STIAD|nr:ATP-binding protein [Stigmatella aurantiaca]ADO72542.1 Sensor protein [Stigmatella aurantiaca DW4/3-1]EAU62119.1 hybrid sensor [Stigmatella aurantiaca DW4/3-1]
MSDRRVTAAPQESIPTPLPERQGASVGESVAGGWESELPYRELFLTVAELIPEALYTKDLQGRYTYINSAGARYLGLPIPEIIGRKDSELMTPEEAQNTLEFDRQTLLAGRTLHAEMTEFLGGVRREWISTKGIIRRADGQMVGMFGISRDVSEHRRSEAAQLQSEALFRATASSSFDAFFLLREDPEGLRLLRLNSHGEALLGCQATEAEGGLFTDFPQAGFIAPPHLCQEVWRTGKPHDEEIEQALPQQGRRWFRRQLSAVGNCMAVMLRDITRQRENELRLRLNERMAAIGMLAAGVAHEINNPLAFVSSNLNFIDTELRRPPPSAVDMAELKEAISDAREGAERMRIIVQSLKALSRGDSITTQPVDLHEVLENSVHLAWSRLRSKGRLVRDYGELSPVLGNSVQLSQVFVNLIINAAQALRKTGGEIRLVTRMHSPHRALVEVHDNGCGIAAEHLDRIFEPFFTTKPVGEGTGLGLSISHDIIRGLGGELSVSSTLDVGTTFRILLPASPEAPPQDTLPADKGVH